MLYGDRLTKMSGVMIFEDTINNIKAVVKMDTDEKKGFFGKKK